DESIEGLGKVVEMATQGEQLIKELMALIRDERAPGQALGAVNSKINELDRRIEETGFHHPPLGPVTRMFIFAKENLLGSDALSLASQMQSIYADLGRRSKKLSAYYNSFS